MEFITLPNILAYKKYVRNSFFYFGGSLVQLVFAFFSQPIYAKYLSAKDFGILGYFSSVQGFFNPLFLFGMTQYYLMNYFRQKEDENKDFLFNILAYLSLANILISSIGFIVLMTVFKGASVSVPFMPFSLFIFLIMYFNIYTSFLLIDLRIRKKAISYFIFSAIPPALNVGFGLFYVINLKMGAAGKLFGQVTTNILIGLLSLFFLRKYLKPKLNLLFIRKSFKYVLPLVGAGYAYYPIQSIDKIFLERLKNLSELGYYSIGITAANFISMASFALFMAFEPDVYRYVAEKSFLKLKKIAGAYLLLVSLMIVVFILISPYLMNFLTSGRYTRAYKYANINAIGVFFMQVFGFLNAVIIAMKHSDYALYINIIGGIAAISIYYLLIKQFAFTGANYAYVAVGIVLSAVSLLFIKNISRNNFSI